MASEDSILLPPTVLLFESLEAARSRPDQLEVGVNQFLPLAVIFLGCQVLFAVAQYGSSAIRASRERPVQHPALADAATLAAFIGLLGAMGSMAGLYYLKSRISAFKSAANEVTLAPMTPETRTLTQRLSTERSRSSAALKEWGVSEGPDLGDVLTKMSQLFDSLSSAELAFAQHDANFRLAFKSVRTKEENLAQLKRNQSSLASKIDSQEKRVSKMKEENKDLPNATVKLREMRDEMAGLENTVMNEETRLGDYKRSTTREAMSLKLGALLELAEKAIIIGEIGKLIVDEIPVEQTEPGAPRARYQAFDRTEQHMNEATRCLGEVVFNPTPLSPSQGNYEDRVGSNEEPRGGAAAYEAPGEYNQSTFASQQNSAGAFGSQQYGEPATPNSGAPYSSNYGDYPGNGQDGERDDQGPSQYGYQSESLQPGGLPIIRHASPLVGADALPEIDTPTGEYNPTSSPFGKNKALLGGVSRYEQEPNRSSLAYMDDNGEDYEQRQADEEAAEERLREEEDSRRQEEHTPRNETVDVRGPRPLPSLNLPDHIRHSPYLDQVTSPTNMTSPTQMTSPSSNYAEPTMIPVVIPDVAPAPSSMFAATRPSKPGMIRGESALGSKHGDIYVAGTNGSNNGGLPPPVSAPFQGSGTSGYNSRSGGDSSSITSGSGAAGRINAGAFRRAPPQPSYSLPPTQQGDSRYPSQADSIREAYYAQSQAQSGAQDYIESPRGSIVEADSPRFDISPLHVQKRQERQVRTPLYAGGSGHDGPTDNEESWRPSAGDEHEALSEPPSSRIPPPSYAPSSSSTGFSASQFVTRLD